MYLMCVHCCCRIFQINLSGFAEFQIFHGIKLGALLMLLVEMSVISITQKNVNIVSPAAAED